MEWITILFVLSVLWLETECSGKIWLRLVYFNNARGKGSNGHYCDGKFFVRGSDCDHRFIICFDTVDGPQNTNVCAYGRLRSVTVFNTNYITFGSTFGQVSNPMTFDFNRWGGSCKLKVDVYDDDDNSDDYVDFLHYNYYKSTPYYNESVAVKTDVTLRNRVLFNVEMKVYCDPDYYGNGCDIYCKATAKFTCNKQTGTKICLEDWTGTDCNVRKDACLSAPCKNQATCHNSMGSYLCVCPDGYTGTQCDLDVDECLSSPCKNNGTCTDLINNYKCTCPKGFRGQDCSDLIDLCLSNPCLNNGSCHMDPNDVKFHCDCPEGYDGLICDTDIDECAIDICKNGATCENSIGSFKCHCTDGWEGDTCDSDIDECLKSNCFGNATCQNTNGSFNCICDHGYTGVLCDVDIDECSSSPCLNGAFCHDELNGFTCECSKGYTGNLCREEIDECSEDGGKIMMILDGVVTTDHEEKLISSITETILKYGVYNIKSINITNLDIRHLCLEEDRSIKCSSNVTFSIAINGTMLCGEKVKEIESLIRDNDMFKQSSSGIGQQISRAMTENQHISKKTWFANNWYVVAIVIVLVVGAVGVALFVLVRHKRRKLLYLEGAGYTSNSISWHSGTGASNTLPSLAFDNDLYTSGLQEQQTGNIPIQENPDLAFENDMYQQVIPEEQTKLMKCDVDRFDDDFH